MGTLRLLLAFFVLNAHCGKFALPFLPNGRLSVQIFFILSGFYISMGLKEKYPETPQGRRAFWLSRIRRIFPIYYIVLGLTLLCFLLPANLFSSPIQSPDRTLSLWANSGPILTAAAALAHISILGLDSLLFLMPIDHGISIPTDGLHWLLIIPQSWSLPLELAFYAIAPWLCRKNDITIGVILLTGCLARIYASMALGVNDDLFDYRFFPFEIPLFALGILSYRFLEFSRLNPKKWLTRPMALLPLVAIPVFHSIKHHEFAYWITYLAVATALPSLFTLTNEISWDKILGTLSYPLYLGHHITLGLIYPMLSTLYQTPLIPCVVLIATAALSMLLIKIDATLSRGFHPKH